MSVVRTQALTKRYGDLRALDGLSLSVDRGELFGFLGPNGAGKTTTLEILTGQLVPDSGEAEVLGVDPVAEPVETRRRVGILPEQASPPSFMTPREYLSFVGSVREMADTTVDERTATWADRLSFREKLDTLCTDLSRGQQQKVMVASAFLHEPAVAFIDEPLVNLDPIVQERLKQHLREYVDAGNAVFLSTHHIEVAAEVCTRVGIVNRGRLIAEREGDAVDDGEALLGAFLDHVEGDGADDAEDGTLAGDSGTLADGSGAGGEGSP